RDHARLIAASQEHITPLAVVDDEVRERNLRRMQERANAHGLRLRPHAKTHKSAYVAMRQMEHGAVGLTAATMQESEVFADAGVRGLMTHAGHSYRAANDAQIVAAAEDEAHGLVETASLLRDEGIAVRELSIGSTPTAGHVEVASGVTEMRPGTYVYGDANNVQLGALALDDCALAVVATVVSRPERTRAVIDAGSKALPADLRVAGLTGFGIVLGHPGVTLERLSEEHGVLVSEGSIDLRVGDRVAVIPAHACTTVNLHPALLVVADSHSRWEPVDARGWR